MTLALRRVSRDQRGIALPMALGFMMVLSIAFVTVLELSSSSQRHSNVSKAEQVAVAVAEAGLNQAESVLANASNPASASALPSSCAASPVVTVEGGTACYWGSLSGSTWTVYGRSTVRNPTGGADLTHEVSQQMTVSGGGATTANNPAWNYIYSDSPTGCMTVTSSVQIKQPLYVKNDFCLESSAVIKGEAGKVYVGGKITTNSSVFLGEPSSGSNPPWEQIEDFRVGIGCRYGIPYPGTNSTGYVFPCTSGHRVYAASQSQTVPPVSKPPMDLPNAYATAKPGPMNKVCSPGSGTPPGGPFDNDTTMNNTAPSVNLFASNYNCEIWSGGVLQGKIQYNTTPNPDVLTISGTVYFDGDIVMSGSQYVVVSGRGTIYTSGRIWLDSSLRICGKWDAGASDCDWAAWDPDVNMVTFVSGSCTSGLPCDTYGIELNSSVRIQAGFYAVGDYMQTSSAVAQGPVVARQLFYDSSTGSAWIPYDNLTPGAPAAAGSATVAYVPGSWRG
jgi:Tfp pilus assembly protein PilX